MEEGQTLFSRTLTGVWKSSDSPSLFYIFEEPLLAQRDPLEPALAMQLRALILSCKKDSFYQAMALMESLYGHDFSLVIPDQFDCGKSRLYLSAFSPWSSLFFVVHNIVWNQEAKQLHLDLFFPSTKWKLDLFVEEGEHTDCFSVKRINPNTTEWTRWEPA